MPRFLRFLLIFIVLVAIVLILLAARVRPVPPHPALQHDGVLVIAHQGGEWLWPSNTMLAFENAVALGVDVLEADIHRTADGALVLIHDSTVDRTTDGSGRVMDMTLAEIQALDAGHYWTEDGGQTHPFRGQGIRIATLEELLATFPQMPMVLEIKPETPSIVADVCAMMRAYDMQERAILATFHASTVQEIRETCPEFATSMVEGEIRTFFVLNTIFLGRLYQAPAEAFQVPEYAGGLHVVTERFVRNAQRHNIAVHVWTVNETEDMQRLLALGVDGIITDRPDRLLALLGR